MHLHSKDNHPRPGEVFFRYLGYPDPYHYVGAEEPCELRDIGPDWRAIRPRWAACSRSAERSSRAEEESRFFEAALPVEAAVALE